MAAVVLADRYALGDVLGRGGMADVHRATDRVLGRPVAVKVLRETAADRADRLRFTAEARTLARLSHPGLVMVLDAGMTAERPYLVMELVEGHTLAQLCVDGPLPTGRVAALGAQVAAALAYVHGAGVLHRDVKPGNVIVTAEDRTKLADFGIARLIGDAVRHTQTGHAIGTAAYLAPEQVRGDEMTTAVDVYSLGLVLLEAATGERSFPGSATEAALARLSRDPEVPSTLSARWQTLLAAMTAMAPGQRPTAADVADELSSLASSGPRGLLEDACGGPAANQVGSTRVLTVGSASPGASATTLRPVRGVLRKTVRSVPGHQRAVVAAVAAILLLVVVVAIASGGGGGSNYQPPPNTPSPLQKPLTDLHDAVNGR